jgi:hypothetical protein
MAIVDNRAEGDDIELAARLRKLDAGAGEIAPGFGYDALLDRHATRQRRARRRVSIARGVAGALALVLVSASLWRFERADSPAVTGVSPEIEEIERATEPRIVRADTYFAVAALEDHIAIIDEALNDARARAGAAEVARLEHTRAELVDSYKQVRYAEMLSANL